MTSPFDECSGSYRDLVNDAVSIGGVEHEFYVRRKVDHLLDLASSHLGDPSGLTVLDLGCGVGLADTLLGDRLGELHGVDPSGESVAAARERNPGVRYRAYDGTHLPHDDASFDLVFAMNVLHHVEPADRVGFAAEMARVTRPGGLCCVFEHNPYNPLTRWAVDRCEFDEGVVLLSRRGVSELLSGAGLGVVESRYIIFVPRDNPTVVRAERWLQRVPLGAQHAVAARRPR